MCIGIPAEIIATGKVSGVSRPATVRRPDGIVTPADLVMLPEASVGDFVIVHSGYAVSLLTDQEASMAIELLTKGGSVK